jgi:uncharacterized protein (DUF58 family)
VRIRPQRPRPALLVLILLAFAFFGISRTSGAGWATVLVAGIIGAIIVGAFAPVAVVRRARLSIEAPEAGTVGSPMELALDARGPVVADIAAFGTGPFALHTGTLSIVPTKRGVFRVIEITVSSTAPLGFMPWRRRFTVDLGRDLEIGPSPLSSGAPVARQARDTGDEDVRSTREYEPGDTFKSIHWPATARTGTLIVRQMDAPTAPDVVIAVDLSGDRDLAEIRASRAAGLARAALDMGAKVTLATCETSGPVTSPVTSARAINARLARAIDGPLNLPGDYEVTFP